MRRQEHAPNPHLTIPTSPMPSENTNGLPLSREESNFLPFSRVPAAHEGRGVRGGL